MTSAMSDAFALLLATHLNERARRRCQAVAHGALHAMLDYDRGETG